MSLGASSSASPDEIRSGCTSPSAVCRVDIVSRRRSRSARARPHDPSMAERDVPAAPHRDAQRMHCVEHELATGMDVTDVATTQLVYLMTLHEMLKFNDVANATAEFDDLLLA